MFINNLIIGGNKMSNLTVKVVVVNLSNNEEHIVADNINLNDAKRIITAANKEIELTNNEDKVKVAARIGNILNTIQIYKDIFDKVLEVINGNKGKATIEEFDWDTYDTNKEVKECIEEYKKKRKGKLIRDRYLKK